jgi:hypothetical protein
MYGPEPAFAAKLIEPIGGVHKEGSAWVRDGGLWQLGEDIRISSIFHALRGRVV